MSLHIKIYDSKGRSPKNRLAIHLYISSYGLLVDEQTHNPESCFESAAGEEIFILVLGLKLAIQGFLRSINQ